MPHTIHINLKTEQEWQAYLVSLLKKNGYDFNPHKYTGENNKVRFVHFSPHIDKILKTQELSVSSGGLFGVVYATLLDSNNMLSNLGHYIFETELAHLRNTNKISCLVLEIDTYDFIQSLEYGKLNYVLDSNLYDGLIKLSAEQKESFSKLLLDTYTLFDDLSLNNYVDMGMWHRVQTYFDNNKLMKHIFFEAFNEYMYSHQDSPDAKKLAKNGELLAQNIKDYIFMNSPEMKHRFSTERFSTQIDKHITMLGSSAQKIFVNFETTDFLSFMHARIRSYVGSLLNKPASIKGRYILKTSNSSRLRTIEQYGAERMWSMTKDSDIVYYANIAKGEWGVKPKESTSVYIANYQEGYIHNLQKTNISISPYIIDNKNSVLRVK